MKIAEIEEQIIEEFAAFDEWMDEQDFAALSADDE